MPVPRVAAKRIPLLATLPNATTGRTQPAAGWPVVIFQHGITLNRTVLFAIADSFAQAGFAVVAIDLPLHGVTDTANPFYQGPTSPFGNNERHFNLDNVGATGVFAPDGQIDNGWQILNLQNPLNARDHIRQAVADTIHLTRTIRSLNFPDGDPDPDLDRTRIHFVGISLGSIISGVFLGLNTDVRPPRCRARPAPGPSILTDPEAIDFGAPIRAALSAQGLPPGTVGFDDFVRDLQTLIDPVDPINYAADAAAGPSAARDRDSRRYGRAERPDRLHRVAVGPSERARDGARRRPRRRAASCASKREATRRCSIPRSIAAVTVEMQRETVTYAASLGRLFRSRRQRRPD